MRSGSRLWLVIGPDRAAASAMSQAAKAWGGLTRCSLSYGLGGCVKWT